jgi:hypothetical protein
VVAAVGGYGGGGGRTGVVSGCGCGGGGGIGGCSRGGSGRVGTIMSPCEDVFGCRDGVRCRCGGSGGGIRGRGWENRGCERMWLWWWWWYWWV